jgi:hypothetical protein
MISGTLKREGGMGMRNWSLVGDILLTAAQPVAAEDWAREVGGWDVGRTGDTCVMTMEYEGEGSTELTLIIRNDAADTYLFVSNYRWSAKADERYELKYYLGERVYTLPSVGIEDGAIRKGFATMASADFLSEFAKASGLTIARGDVLVDDLSLDGSAAALGVLERCRRELARDLEQQRRDREALAHIPVDPFAPTAPTRPIGTTGPRDPAPIGAWRNLIGGDYARWPRQPRSPECGSSCSCRRSCPGRRRQDRRHRPRYRRSCPNRDQARGRYSRMIDWPERIPTLQGS